MSCEATEGQSSSRGSDQEPSWLFLCTWQRWLFFCWTGWHFQVWGEERTTPKCIVKMFSLSFWLTLARVQLTLQHNGAHHRGLRHIQYHLSPPNCCYMVPMAVKTTFRKGSPKRSASSEKFYDFSQPNRFTCWEMLIHVDMTSSQSCCTSTMPILCSITFQRCPTG